MILDLIVKAAVSLFKALLALFPAYSLPDQVKGLGDTIGSAVAGLNGVVPVVTIGACLAVVLAARVFLFLVGLLVWVYNLIPFKAT